MEKDRLVAFTDGVVAVIITIMALDLKPPAATDNHHHFFHLVTHVTGGMLWANLHLLFWLSLIPFATNWLGAYYQAAVPTSVYGLALLMPAPAWYVMQTVIIRADGDEGRLRQAIGSDLKGKLSPLLYLAGILFAFVDVRIADLIYVLVALVWLVPDRRIERMVRQPRP